MCERFFFAQPEIFTPADGAFGSFRAHAERPGHLFMLHSSRIVVSCGAPNVYRCARLPLLPASITIAVLRVDMLGGTGAAGLAVGHRAVQSNFFRQYGACLCSGKTQRPCSFALRRSARPAQPLRSQSQPGDIPRTHGAGRTASSCDDEHSAPREAKPSRTRQD